jgi:four helix bundle protein
MKLEEMDVFKLGHELTLDIYRKTSFFPDNERFGIISQMRRAAVSICSNLTEGYHRGGKGEFKYFVGIARGSCGELGYQLRLARDLSYLDDSSYNDLARMCDRVIMMLNKLASSLK